MADWQIWKIDASVEIEDKQYAVSSAAINFELNAIPSAQVTLPVGRDIASINEAPIHKRIKTLKQKTPIKIIFEITKAKGSADKPEFGKLVGKHTVFEGFTAGTGYRKVRGSAEFVLSLKHILSDLDSSSCFSATSHPSNPSGWSFGAVSNSGGIGKTTVGGLTPIFSPDDLINTGTIATDIWGQALFLWLERLTKVDGFHVNESFVGPLKGGKENKGAAEALKRMTPKKSKHYLELAVDLGGAAGGVDANEFDLGKQISEHTGYITHNPDLVAQQTMWEIIQKFSQSYFFSIVPRAVDAIVVPFVPAYQKTWATIDADAYASIQLDADTPSPLRAIGLMVNRGAASGGQRGDLVINESAIVGLGGWFEGQKEGKIIFKPAPAFLSSVVTPTTEVTKAAGGDGEPIGNAVRPGKGKKNEKTSKDNTKKQLKTLKGFINRYARAIYITEAISARQGVISGPLRFDIAPGSSIKIEGSGEKFIASDGLGMPFFATVLRTSVYVDSERKTAGTSFHLGYIRSEEENKEEATSIDRHPLYMKTFAGCPLLEPADPKDKKDGAT